MPQNSVCIILTNYNHARYLPQSLGAIFAQTRPADQVIVIDDGSSDGSSEVIEEFQRQHENLLFLRNSNNRGALFSISRALGAVRCKFVVWAAADDRLMPEFLEKSLAALDRHPQAGLCFSEVTQIKGDTEITERFATNPDIAHIFDLSNLPEYMSPAVLRERMRQNYLAIHGNTIVCRFDALINCNLFVPALAWHADQLAFYAVAIRYGACVVPETLALIRAHEGSFSQSGMNDERRQRQVLTTHLDLLRERQWHDVRAFFRSCPCYFSPFGALMLRVMLFRPRDWDLMFPYFLWKVREYKRGRRLSWPVAMTRLMRDLTLFAIVKLRRS